jgi:hypothetical protein
MLNLSGRKMFCSFTAGTKDGLTIWDNIIISVNFRINSTEHLRQIEDIIIAEVNPSRKRDSKVDWLTIISWQYV